jgi:hypothetical protein
MKALIYQKIIKYTIYIVIIIYNSFLKIPSLPFQESNDWTWTLFICVNLAMLAGFAIMFLLVVFEEHIFI